MRYLSLCLILLLSILVPSGFCQPLTDYLYMTDHETTIYNQIIWFWGRDILEGDVHSNDYIGMKGIEGQPHFYGGVVSTSQPEFICICGADPYFEYEPQFSVEPLELPENLLPLRDLSIQQGNYYPNNPQDRQQGRLVGSENGWILELWEMGIPYDSTIITLLDTITYNPNNNWLCLFFEGDLELYGDAIQGKNIIGAAGNMRLLDNLMVEGATIDSSGVEDIDNDNMLYIASEGDVVIADTYANGRGNGDSCPEGHERKHIVITSGVFAVGESFTFEHQNDSWDPYRWCDPEGPHAGEMDERGDIYLYGSLVQHRRGFVHRSNCGGTGYSKRYTYDPRWEENPVPLLSFNNPDAGSLLQVENDTIVVDDTQRFAYGDTVRLGPGAHLIFANNGRYEFQGNARIVVQGTEENPAVIIDNSSDSESPIAPFFYQYDTESSNIWSHFILETNGSFTFLDGQLENGSIISQSDSSILNFSNETTIDINDMYLEGHFKINTEGHPSSFHHSLIIGRLIIESPMTIDHATVVHAGANNAFPGILTRDAVSILNTTIFGYYSRPVKCSHQEYHTTISYSSYYRTNSDVMRNVDVGPGVFEANPRFIDFYSDYHLRPDSPLIDAGDPNSALDEDGTRTDIGCYPFLYGDHQLDTEENSEESLPQSFTVHGPWPNPCNNETVVQLQLLEVSPVKIDIYDVLGRKVRSLAQQQLPSGLHTLPVRFEREPAGIYFLSIEVGQHREMAKVVLIH